MISKEFLIGMFLGTVFTAIFCTFLLIYHDPDNDLHVRLIKNGEVIDEYTIPYGEPSTEELIEDLKQRVKMNEGLLKIMDFNQTLITGLVTGEGREVRVKFKKPEPSE